MWCARACFLPIATVAMLVATLSARPHATVEHATSTVERFLAIDDPDPWEYSATRSLEAHNDKFGTDATMTVRTEADVAGFRYRIVSETGSEYVRNRVFRQTLETERAMWASGAPSRAGFTQANYVFDDRGVEPGGLLSLGVKPRRKDILLVDGALFLSPDDGDLVRMEGRLVKSPSFWTRHVHVVRWYKRFAGVRMPVVTESTASVLVAGRSTLRMTYEYQSVNGQRVAGQVPTGSAPPARY
jgi:hypothetical protein